MCFAGKQLKCILNIFCWCPASIWVIFHDRPPIDMSRNCARTSLGPKIYTKKNLHQTHLPFHQVYCNSQSFQSLSNLEYHMITDIKMWDMLYYKRWNKTIHQIYHYSDNQWSHLIWKYILTSLLVCQTFYFLWWSSTNKYKY